MRRESHERAAAKRHTHVVFASPRKIEIKIEIEREESRAQR